MASSPLCFSDLKAGRNAQPVVARLLRFWEARNVKKGGELMGVDMLLLDEKVNSQLHIIPRRFSIHIIRVTVIISVNSSLL